MEIAVSIIMPVYNAAASLQRSLESIAAQTCRDFELVFVDDCSTDSTPAILEEFSHGSGIPCRIVRQERNKGVASARNAGLAAASGRYLAFVDADDSIEPGALASAMDAAVWEDADIIGWDWTLGFEKNGRYMRQADYDSPLQALKNLMGGTMRWNLWLFAVRRSMVEENGIRFLDGKNMGEDMMFMIKCFLAAGKTSQIHRSLYRYNAVSESSISRRFSEERRDEAGANLAETETAVRESKFAADLEDHIQYLKLFVKLPLLISADRGDYELWYRWYPESNAYAAANKALPARTRFLQQLAAKRCWFAVKAWYILIYKFIYGVIYR